MPLKWKTESPSSDGKQRQFLFHFYVRTVAFCVVYTCCGNKIKGCGLQLRDSLFQDSLAVSFLPSSLVALKVKGDKITFLHALWFSLAHGLVIIT